MEPSNANCPLCGSVISRAKFVEITRIREQEQRELAETKSGLEENFRRDLEVVRQAEHKRAEEEAQKQVAAVTAERDRNLQKVKELENQQTALRKQAEEEAQRRKTMEEQYQRDLKAQTEAASKRAAEDAEKRAALAIAERDRNVQKVKELEQREATIRKEAAAEAERNAQKELERERLILQQDKDAALLKQQVDFNHERDSWQKKAQELQRQLEQKTAHQLGDGAELNLFEVLRDAFQGEDQITRIQTGQQGADICHKVIHKGEVCGQIIYDSKNHQAWRDLFVTKLRDDQLEAKADFAVLSTAVFPREKKGLFVADCEVIVATPAQVSHLARLLRQFLVTMHVRGLTLKQRAGKTNQLFQYISSTEYSQRFSQISLLNQDLQEIDVQEQNAHRKVWKKRGELLVSQQRVLREIEGEIAIILESDAGPASSAA
jgi:hypothetical protein